MKKSLIKNAVKFMQNQSYEYRRVYAELAQFGYVRSTVVGGGAKI